MNNRYDHLRDKLDSINKDALLHLTGEKDMIELDPNNPHRAEWFEKSCGLDCMKEIAQKAMSKGNFSIDDVRDDLKEYRMSKHMDFDNKMAAIQAGGSLKTIHKIDAQTICGEVRGKV